MLNVAAALLCCNVRCVFLPCLILECLEVVFLNVDFGLDLGLFKKKRNQIRITAAVNFIHQVQEEQRTHLIKSDFKRRP